MDSNTIQVERSRVSIWVQAVRMFAFPASVVPVLAGGALAFAGTRSVAWELYPIIIICAVLYHAATNLISDYFDWQNGVDKDYTFGSSRVIAEGLLTPQQVLRGGWVVFGAGILLGLVLVYVRGLPMFLFGLVGLIGGYIYTGRPVGFKYFALGDVGVFTLMGPLMVTGSYYALTGGYDPAALYVSIPIGMLTAAILHSNNTRDIQHDSEARVKTFAGVIGHGAAKVEYMVLVCGAFAAVGVMMATGVLPVWSAGVVLSLPPAIKNMRTMLKSSPGKIADIATLDVTTAQHALLFGLLLVISIVVGAVI